MRFWHVYISLPPDEAVKYSRNKTLGVAAPTLFEAAHLVEEEYPSCTIWTVQHRGEVHHAVAEFKDGWTHNEDKAAQVKH